MNPVSSMNTRCGRMPGSTVQRRVGRISRHRSHPLICWSLPRRPTALIRIPVPDKPAPRLRSAVRDEVQPWSLSLDQMLPPDHPARCVWAFAEGLDLSALYAAIKATEGRPGHPHVDPRILFALWLFATIDGVGSARELGRLC